jgi:hypothetical protein
MKINYDQITYLELECCCADLPSNDVWDSYMKGATRANVKAINRLVKKHLPDLYEQLALNFYNPYHYLKNQKHLILVHSGIEYFIKYK